MTTKTAIRKGRISAKTFGLKALPDEGPGIFSAVVSVFGNVDYHGDRILPGAFTASLEGWKASGDPIPVIFSHQWDNPDAHVGEVLEARELLAGDPLLAGTGLEQNGGLWTKFQLYVEDPDETAARRLAKRLDRRTIREFSFAYDVLEEQRGSDGANELVALDVLEVGPTLKGANPATRLLAKTLGEDWDQLGETELIDRLAKAVAARDAGTEKARVSVTFEGSIEEELEAIHEAGRDWAIELDAGNGGFYWLHQEATYPDELRAIVLVEGWDDPIGEGVFYELTFERDEDGALSVADAAEIEVTVDVTPKALARRRLASVTHGAKRGTVALEPNTGKSEDNGEEPEGANPEDPGTRTGAGEEADDVDDDAEVLDELALAELETLTP